MDKKYIPNQPQPTVKINGKQPKPAKKFKSTRDVSGAKELRLYGFQC